MTDQSWKQEQWQVKVQKSQIKEAENAFKEAFEIRKLEAAKFLTKSNVVQSSWSFVDVQDMKTRKKISYESFLEPTLTTKTIQNCADLELRTSQGDIEARLFRQNGKDFLQISNGDSTIKSISLDQKGLHGPAYFDDRFSGLSIHPEKPFLAYIAEKHVAKSLPFFQWSEQNLETAPGQEFNYRNDWGEKMEGKSTSVIAIWDWSNNDHWILKLPYDDYAFGNVSWVNSLTLVGTATLLEPYRLGCVLSIPTKIFRLDFTTFEHLKGEEEGCLEFLSADGRCARSPRLSPFAKHLIWLERPLSDRTHSWCLQLKCLDLSNKQNVPKIVIDSVSEFDPLKDIFAGLYKSSLPNRCFINEHEIIFSEVVLDTLKMFKCNLESQSLELVHQDSKDQCESVLDVSFDKKAILYSASSCIKSPSLRICTLNSESTDLEIISGTDFSPYFAQATISSLNCTSVFVTPNKKKQENCSLICWPHGGPHVVATKEFNSDVLFWLKLGFAILRPNYRGSTGAGLNFLTSLIGHSGDFDVKDCYEAVQDCKISNVYLFGGSHGGQIVLHLAGQYPTAFKACVPRTQ